MILKPRLNHEVAGSLLSKASASVSPRLFSAVVSPFVAGCAFSAVLLSHAPAQAPVPSPQAPGALQMRSDELINRAHSDPNVPTPLHQPDHVPGAPLSRRELVQDRGNEKIWCALVLATNDDHTHPVAPEMELISKKIEHFFGYKDIDVIGTASRGVGDNLDHWLVPSPAFWLNVKSRREGAYYMEEVEVFHDQRRILKTEARLALESPLLIRGPLHDDGQLVIVLEVLP